MAATLETTEERSRKRMRHSEAEVAAGLTQLALSGGNSMHAERALAQDGIEISASTLREWRSNGQSERYRQIRAELMPRIHDTIAAECEDRALAQSTLEASIEARLAETVGELKPSEAAGALRNVSTSKAINIDKAALLRNKPTAIVEHRSVDEDLSWLARNGVIDSTAEVIEDVEPAPAVPDVTDELIEDIDHALAPSSVPATRPEADSERTPVPTPHA